MRHWVGIVSEEQFATERLYARDLVAVPAGSAEVDEGDSVALVVAGAPAVLFGQGTVRGRDATGAILVAYQSRLFDEPPPVPADVMPGPVTPGLHPVPSTQFARLSTLVSGATGAQAGHAVWFVSVALPVEASSRAEAVREFWTYIDKLGPKELPAYVWPLGDELAMQAFVLGAVTNLDPEEDED